MMERQPGRESQKDNDLFYTCSLIDYIARKTKNKRVAVVDALGKERIAKIYDLADIYHSDNIERVSDDFIEEAKISVGNFDNVGECQYAVPSHWDIGKVYKRLIKQVALEKKIDVVDAIIAGGGMVGGLGERYTRVAAAHSVHNGLTVLPQTEKFLHGTKVAYGILVQSALLGQDDVLAQLITAYQRFNLPTRLAQLEVDINNRAEIDKVIAHTLRPVESIHALPVTLTPETLRAAFEKVESFTV